MKDQTLSEEERNKRLHMVYLLWKQTHEGCEKFIKRNKPKKFNFRFNLLHHLKFPDAETVYFYRNGLFRKLKYAYEGREEEETSREVAFGDEEIKKLMEELKAQARETDAFVKGLVEESKKLKSIFTNAQ